MSIRRIAQPIAGEHAVAIHPKMAPTVSGAAWRKHLRLYTGRTLSDRALTAEQDHRAGHIVTLAQTLSPGVIAGLEVTLEWPADATGQVFLHVAPGRGLTTGGEDVIVHQPLRVALSDLLPEGGIGSAQAAVLVLEPVEVLAVGQGDEEDPCEIDESALGFVDEQRVDGALLRLLPWDDAWHGAPLTAATAQRNALAYAIFAREQQHLPGERHPWEAVGVPLGVLGFSAGALDYLDRFAVVRAGGHARRRSPLVAQASLRAGTPFLWHARIQQLAAHLQDLALEDVAVTSWVSGLRRLPPAGLMPLAAIDIAARSNRFFPANYALRMAPLPLEQLDWLLERCQSLAPLDVAAPEQVLVIVPVPQAVYEPKLLVTELEAPEFAAAISSLRASREAVRAHRLFVRQRHTALAETIDNPLVATGAPTLPSATPVYGEPGKLETEPDVTAVQGDESAFGIETDAAPTPASATLRPRAWLDLRTLVGTSVLSAAEKTAFRASGLAAFVPWLRKRIDEADDAIDFSFLKAHTDIYRVRQLMLGTTVASRLLTSPALAMIVKAETAVAQRDEVSRFYQSIKGKLPFAGIEGATANEDERVREAVSGGGIGAEVRSAEPLIGDFALGVAGLGFAGTRSVETLRFVEEDVAGFVAVRERVAIPQAHSAEEVRNAGPSPGADAYDFRTTTIGKRLDAPPATEARSYVATNRYEAMNVLGELSDKGLNFDDVRVAGVATTGFGPDGSPNRTSTRTFSDLKATRFAALKNDPLPQNPIDDAAFMLESVRLLEHNIATMRGIEARIAQYRAVLGDCERVLASLRGELGLASTRLVQLDEEVDDLRHRVATAVALRADEVRRVQVINDRRAAVIAQHVRVLAYARPRGLEAIVDAPAVLVDTGLLPAAVPTCFAEHDDPPAELERMVQLLRELPVAWFRHVPKALEKLDRVELLHGTIMTAQLRAKSLLMAQGGAPGSLLTFAMTQTTTVVGKKIATVIQAQHARVAQRRLLVSQLDVARYVGLGWRETRDQVVDVLTLGDLIESNHGRRIVAQTAARELDQIGRIAACLYAQVSEVEPVIRLRWAELLGQHDEGVALGNLAALPRFGELPFADRKDLQELTDWLYERVDPKQPEAIAWMHDLVRVCILLASHAPVDEIVAGHVPVESQASPGAFVPVAIDPVRVKLGMRALFFRDQQLVAHGVVDDLTGLHGRARVLESMTGSAVTLPKDTKVRFIAAGAPFLPSAFMRVR